MYGTRGNLIYFREELFLTVHPTKNCTKTPEEQAEIIAELLNACSEEVGTVQ